MQKNAVFMHLFHILKSLKGRTAQGASRKPEVEADEEKNLREKEEEENRNHIANVRHRDRNLREFCLDEPYLPRRRSTNGFGVNQRRPGGRTHIGGGKHKSQLPPLKSRAQDYLKMCRAKRKSGPPV